MLALAAEFRAHEASTDHRFVVYNMLGWERLQALHGDLAARAAGHTIVSARESADALS